MFALADSPNLAGLTRLILNDAWLWKKAVVERLGASQTLASCRIFVKGTLLARSPKPEAKSTRQAEKKPAKRKSKPKA